MALVPLIYVALAITSTLSALEASTLQFYNSSNEREQVLELRREASLFFVKDYNQLCASYQRIHSLEICKLAATELTQQGLGKSFYRTEWEPSWPKGCYQTAGFTYWNNDNSGSANDKARPICKTQVDQCGQYGGITHPTNPTKCCSSACANFCGAWNCDKGPGGSTSCCGSGIRENLVCGVGGRVAPCNIRGLERIVTCKWHSGACANWKEMTIKRYSTRTGASSKSAMVDCHNLCAKTQLCADFFVSLRYRKCWLFKQGCKYVKNSDWFYYPMKECTLEESNFAYSSGCEQGKACSNGRGCGSNSGSYGLLCQGCSFNECLYRAQTRGSLAFAYEGTGSKRCRQCSEREFNYIFKKNDWGIYFREEYKETGGACRTGDGKSEDIFSCTKQNNLNLCKQRCNHKRGCGAVSYDGMLCCGLSKKATTTSETAWKCYSKY